MADIKINLKIDKINFFTKYFMKYDIFRKKIMQQKTTALFMNVQLL